MIRFVAAPHDDPEFISLVERITNGAVAALNVGEVFLIHIDNWFDFKWLGWWSWGQKWLKRLVVPPFNPNRVLEQKRFVRDANEIDWKRTHSGRPLHVRRAGRQSFAQPIDGYSESAAFVWYSGNTATNTRGSLMFYGPGDQGDAWYAAFEKKEGWTIHRETRISRRELLSYEERGREMTIVSG